MVGSCSIRTAAERSGSKRGSFSTIRNRARKNFTGLSRELDATGLALGTELHTANLATETPKYFYANFPAGYLGTTVTSLTATPNSSNTLITLNVAGTVNMTFMQLFGINTVNVLEGFLDA